MTGIRPTHNALTLRGSAYHGLQKSDLHLREVKPGVTLEDLKPHVEKNGRDEIFFETADKRLFVLDATTMEPTTGVAPQVGDNIQLADLEGTIVHIDDDKPNDIPAMVTSLSLLFAGALLGGPAGIALAGAAFPAGFLVAAPRQDTDLLDAATDTIAHSPKGSVRAIELMLQMKAEAAAA